MRIQILVGFSVSSADYRAFLSTASLGRVAYEKAYSG